MNTAGTGAAMSPLDSEGTKSSASHPTNFTSTQVQKAKWHNLASSETCGAIFSKFWQSSQEMKNHKYM